MLKGWQDVFQTEDKREVEEELRRTGQDFRWDKDHLKIIGHEAAVETHPVSGEKVWFNHAAVSGRKGRKECILHYLAVMNLALWSQWPKPLPTAFPLVDAILRVLSTLPATGQCQILDPIMGGLVPEAVLPRFAGPIKSWVPHFLWRWQ